MTNESLNSSVQVIPGSVAVTGAIVGMGIMLVGTFGNILVIIAVILSKPLNKVANTFVVSLAICDLFRTVCVMPFHIYTYVMKTWTLGDHVCVYLLFASNLSILEGILHVCTIAFYRYVIILHPRLARGLRSVRAVVIMLMFLYIVPVLITVLPALDKLSSSGSNVQYVTKIMFCAFTHHYQLKFGRMVRKIVFLGCAALFLFYCYIRIYVAVHRSRKQLHVRGQFSPSRVEQEMTLLKTFVIVFVCFVACYMPVSIMYGIDKYTLLNHESYLVVVLLLWLSGSTNWMIYGLFNRQYLHAYKVILCGVGPRRFSRDTNATTVNGTHRNSAYRLRISRSMPEVPAVSPVSESSIHAGGSRSENGINKENSLHAEAF